MAKELTCTILPNDSKGVVLALHLFGASRLDYGEWLRPGQVFRVTQEEFTAANELLSEQGFRLEPHGSFAD